MLGAAEDARWDDRSAGHFDPMLGYEPAAQLILGRSDGGPQALPQRPPGGRGKLAELLLEDGTWLPIRYEWSWQPDTQPSAYAASASLPARRIWSIGRSCPSRCLRAQSCAGLSAPRVENPDPRTAARRL